MAKLGHAGDGYGKCCGQIPHPLTTDMACDACELRYSKRESENAEINLDMTCKLKYAEINTA